LNLFRLNLEIKAEFNWVDRYHGIAEPFWLWVEDGENEHIYHAEPFILKKKTRLEVHKIDFIIPIREPLPPQYYVKAISDRWLGSSTTIPVSFQHLILPDRMPPHTDLLNLHPVPVVALQNPAFEALYHSKFEYFNPIQSQTFHALYHTDINILVGAPTGSGLSSRRLVFVQLDLKRRMTHS
jgi:hypothetical protein